MPHMYATPSPVQEIGVITAAEVDTKILTSKHAVNEQSQGAGVFNIDASLADTVQLTLTASTGQATVTNPDEGQILTLAVLQTGAGSFTVTWPTNFRWQGNTAPTLTLAAGHQDCFAFRYDNTNWIECAGRSMDITTA